MQLRRSPKLQLRQTPARESDDPGVRFCAEAPRENGCALYASGSGTVLDEKQRAELLRAARAGEAVELELEADTYIQRDTPNRNFIRFKPGILASFAKSFQGQPFLRDHDSYSLMSRGGTILASKLVHNDDGSKTIRMRLKLVKAWAVEAALDGTLDRFSIGWSRTAGVECSICEASLAKCDHWPGDQVDGKVCQFVFTGADGTEVSGVNVPAVVGTNVRSISQLSELDRGSLADILAGDTISGGPEVPMNPKILALLVATLGVRPEATDDEIASALEAHGDTLTIERAKQATEADRLTKIETQLAERAVEEKRATIETGISALLAAGKIKPGSDVEGALRRTGERAPEVFRATVADMLAVGVQITPVGAKPPALGADPAPVGIKDGKMFLQTNPVAASWLSKLGITEEQFEKHGGNGREIVAALQTR